MKSGFVAIIGKPNAGKSTLLNSILNKKIAITTDKAQTTRNSILGILNKQDLQIVFVDTPGIHDAKTYLGSYMNKEAFAQANGADVIYYLIDAKKGIDEQDKKVLDKLFSYNIPIFAVLNKIDEVSKDKLIERCAYASANYDFKEIIPISALNHDNIEELINSSIEYLNSDVLFYPENIESISTIEFQISEIIREKILLNTKKEVPHLTAVTIDNFQNNDNKAIIEACIIVNKESHKGIIIGKKGEMLKKINVSSTIDIKKLLNKKVLLSLYVKVEEDWLNKEKKLFDLGYYNE